MYRLLLVIALAAGTSASAQPAQIAPERLPDALASAQPGDTIRVGPGQFTGATLTLDRPVTLIGTGATVLDGDGKRGLLLITADSVSISGFVFRNTGLTFMDDRAAIRLEGTHACVIEDNRFEETFFGLYLAGVTGCLVRRNVFDTTPDRESNGGNAIHSWHSKRLTVVDNVIRGHRDGIYLEFTEDSLVRGNTSTDNLRYGLHFMFSNDCTYEWNTFERNGAGVAVMYAKEVVMRSNRFADAWGSSSFGLLLKEIKGGTVEDNTFQGNSVALFVESSDRITFRHNRFGENGWAIKIMADAHDNLFEANSFSRNTFDVATNSRNVSGSSFEGNYWDRYDGYDLDRDGVGDVPFHPVRLYSMMVEQREPALVLLRSLFVDVLDMIEGVLPVLTPDVLVDLGPSINPIPAR